MRISSYVRVGLVALGLPLMMAGTASSAPLATQPIQASQSSNILDVAVRCGPRAHYVAAHRVRSHGHMVRVPGRCVATPRHH